mmetsp:Transcript_19538/g.39826  ORF Transcript_19538/g.39826 Transcript_19538/m.39826 type:complete len:249 (+) Transcript_19538:48-794(+)
MFVLASSCIVLTSPKIGGTRRAAMLMLQDGGALSGDAWRVTMQELNAAPVFAITSVEGKMLQNGQERVLFFADIDHALLRLSNARMKSPDQGMALFPVGLGTAFAAVSEEKAIFVPGPSEVAAAQDLQLAPDEMAASLLAGAGIESPIVQWGRDALPIFGCFQMSRRRADGSRFTPLFLSSADSQKAFDAALAADPKRAEEEGLEVDCLPLDSVVKLAISSQGSSTGPWPRVLPPTKSTLYLQGKYPA